MTINRKFFGVPKHRKSPQITANQYVYHGKSPQIVVELDANHHKSKLLKTNSNILMVRSLLLAIVEVLDELAPMKTCKKRYLYLYLYLYLFVMDI